MQLVIKMLHRVRRTQTKGEIQSPGATIEKALSPIVFSLVRGTASRP